LIFFLFEEKSFSNKKKIKKAPLLRNVVIMQKPMLNPTNFRQEMPTFLFFKPVALKQGHRFKKQKNRVHELPVVAERPPVPKKFFGDPWNHNDFKLSKIDEL
jgi:hypothetical protein